MESSDEEESTQQCTSGSPKTKVPLPEDAVKSLMNGQLVLPFSEKSPCRQLFHALVDVEKLTIAASCGYWDNGYVLELLHIILLRSKYDVISSDGVVNTCSMSCAEADWESSHSLLCTSESSDSARREAPLKFIKHANKQMIYSSLLQRWWDCIALPNDVDSSDEASFRLQIKMLAFEVRFFRMHRRYDVSGFPTLKFFPKGNKAGEEYGGGRDLDDFVAFINEKSGTSRDVKGQLTSQAGIVESLDVLVKEFVAASDEEKKSVFTRMEEEVEKLKGSASSCDDSSTHDWNVGSIDMEM
ncbi:hypothetical protein JHK84_035601 [Glycine max]|nr:hypothetical protein JHK84_035601 [Glycine max]